MVANAYSLPEWELLLKAVTASPDDDLPRLVAADWLDEHGVPERAEFIRVQIERAKSDRPQLKWREQALWNNPVYGPLWAVEACPHIADLNWGSSLRAIGLSGAERVEFRRGFPYRITCTADEWLRFGHGIVPRQPVREVVLSRCSELELARWWTMATTLRSLTKLEIDNAPPHIASFIRDHICHGVEVLTLEGRVEDVIVTDRVTLPPPRSALSLPPLPGPENRPGRSDIPF